MQSTRSSEMFSSVRVEAFGTPPQGAKASLFALDPVVQNEILETVSDGSLAVTFIDGMDLTLGEDATAIIDEFIFDPIDHSGSAVIQLASGAFHYISGAMHKTGVRIVTPTATVGMRDNRTADRRLRQSARPRWQSSKGRLKSFRGTTPNL